jgi:transposase InsO family protein
MSKDNPLWGAPRIHGELLKLGFEVAESTVSKYMTKHRGPPSQTWRTFLRNHSEAIAAIDLCVVPTLTFGYLFAFLVVSHGRRQLLWFAVTAHPTAEWLAQQIVEAFPWDTAPSYLVRDNDAAYGQAFTNRIRTMGIRDRPIAPRSPWQNSYVERLIGTLRRECLDHVVIFGERHLQRVLTLYSRYYNETRTHLGLAKDAPIRRTVQRSGSLVTTPILSGLHHMIFRRDRPNKSITEKLRDRPIAATHRRALILMARQIQKAPALEARASKGGNMLPLTTYGTAR